MESDSALHSDVPDGAEVLPLEENQAGEAVDASDSNVTTNEEGAAGEESGNVEYVVAIFTWIHSKLTSSRHHYFVLHISFVGATS